LKILVTGSAGNIGRKLVPYLQACGHRVLRADIEQNYAEDYIKADVMFPTELFRAALDFRPQAVFHLAAMVSRLTCEKAAALTVSTNIAGTMNMIELCRMAGAKLINLSTSEIYGNIGMGLSEDREDLQPNNRYGLTKLLTERLVEYETTCELDAVTVRPFMLYDEDETMGTHRSAMIRFAEALVKGEKIEVHKFAQRSWMHMDDAVKALERCAFVSGYYAINIGHPSVISMEDMAHRMCDILGIEFAKHVDIVTQPDRMTLQKVPVLNRQKELLDFEPEIDLDQGLRRVIERVRQRV
jgi:nucleoside-diphosphate-sugar epimerase